MALLAPRRTRLERAIPPVEGPKQPLQHAEGGLEAAARMFGLAAEAGIAASQYEYGVALVNGDGVEVNMELGVHWLWKAMQQGNADAKRDLKQLEEAGVFQWKEYEDGDSPPDAGGAAASGGGKDEV